MSDVVSWELRRLLVASVTIIGHTLAALDIHYRRNPSWASEEKIVDDNNTIGPTRQLGLIEYPAWASRGGYVANILSALRISSSVPYV